MTAMDVSHSIRYASLCVYHSLVLATFLVLKFIDIDECSKSITAICPRGSRCINTNGSYTCTCNEGYFLLQNSTGDINRCEGKLISNNYQYVKINIHT